MATKKEAPDQPLGTVKPSAQAKKETEEVREQQREAFLENQATNVPPLPASGGAVSKPSQRATKPAEFSFESVGPETRLLNIDGKAVLRFQGPEEWAHFLRKVRNAGA